MTPIAGDSPQMRRTKSLEKGAGGPFPGGKVVDIRDSGPRESSGWTNGAMPLPSAPFPSGNKGISLLESRTQCPNFPRGSSFWNYSLTLYYSAGCLMTD